MPMQTKPPHATEAPDDATAARMRALLVRAPMAVAFVRDARFEVVSEHFNHLFGHGDDTDLGTQDTRAVHVSDVAHSSLAERTAAAFASGRPPDEEIEYVRRDGSRFWGRLQATPVRWDAPAGAAPWIPHDHTP